MIPINKRTNAQLSRPARGGWIEILLSADKSASGAVSPREGRVD